MKSITLITNSFFSFIALFLPYPSQADPCNLTDPLDKNPSNFCPTHPSGLRSDSFNFGAGKPYRSPGTLQNLRGEILIQPKSKGFWTGVKTTGNTRVFTESNGNTYQLSK